MIKLSFVGDIMCEEEQLLANKKNSTHDFTNIFEKIKPTLLQSDFVVGNLETPVAGEELIYTNHKWSFNSPIEFAVAIKDTGFDLVSTANNHCLDRGVEGLQNTLKNLEKINLEYTGTCLTNDKNREIYVKKIGGVRIAFLSYTYGTNAAFNNFYLNENNTVNLFRSQEKKITKSKILSRISRKLESMIIYGFTLNPYLLRLKKKIKQAKSEADLVFILMHSGGQYNLIPDNWTIKLMDFLIKNGVDSVIGCHPHVVQKALINKKKQLKVYSLGNFCAYPGSESCKINHSEYSIILHIYLNKDSRKFDKITFQVAKSVIDKSGRTKIHLLYDLIHCERDKQIKNKLMDDNLLIYNRFADKDIEELKLEREYLFFKF